MLKLVTKTQALSGVPIQGESRYNYHFKSLAIPQLNHEKELLIIRPNVQKFSFQKYCKKFDSIQFCEKRINFFDSQTEIISHSFETDLIEKIKIELKKNYPEDEKSEFSLVISIFETKKSIFNVNLSEILHPYCEELAEAMQKIAKICKDRYHLPTLIGVPYAY
ncbi:hypothetical protein NEF87_002359 [Candidatus Lokiarchaeum ossiferum]|uniref:Uncharacterized protein n=1 Tax=Candidatus Lokiarchaeum ossiferum TaxID=2951803 RepID=A0ABY6HRE1_9ARCH|nr:hypothetical protein NEF87_002359 [Candidatus Lokiarchaeum sp. B-35]